MSAICQHRIGSGIGGTHKFLWQEEAQVVDVRRYRVFKRIHALIEVRTLCNDILNRQADVVSMAQYIGSVWLNTTAHQQRHRVSTMLEACYSFDCHHPAFIGIET